MEQAYLSSQRARELGRARLVMLIASRAGVTLVRLVKYLSASRINNDFIFRCYRQARARQTIALRSRRRSRALALYRVRRKSQVAIRGSGASSTSSLLPFFIGMPFVIARSL